MKNKRTELLMDLYKNLDLHDKETLLNFLIRDIFVSIDIVNGEDNLISVCEDIEDVSQNGTMLQINLKGNIDFKDYLRYLK